MNRIPSTIPQSTLHAIEFPDQEMWKDNPRLSSGQSIFNLLQNSVGPIQLSTNTGN